MYLEMKLFSHDAYPNVSALMPNASCLMQKPLLMALASIFSERAQRSGSDWAVPSLMVHPTNLWKFVNRHLGESLGIHVGDPVEDSLSRGLVPSRINAGMILSPLAEPQSADEHRPFRIIVLLGESVDEFGIFFLENRVVRIRGPIFALMAYAAEGEFEISPS